MRARPFCLSLVPSYKNLRHNSPDLYADVILNNAAPHFVLSCTISQQLDLFNEAQLPNLFRFPVIPSRLKQELHDFDEHALMCVCVSVLTELSQWSAAYVTCPSSMSQQECGSFDPLSCFSGTTTHMTCSVRVDRDLEVGWQS